MSKREEQWVIAYYRSEAEKLEDIYTSHSRDKELAFRHCEEAMLREGGKELRIISYNTFQFTAAWRLPDERLHVATRDNDYLIDMRDILPF